MVSRPGEKFHRSRRHVFLDAVRIERLKNRIPPSCFFNRDKFFFLRLNFFSWTQNAINAMKTEAERINSLELTHLRKITRVDENI